MVITLCYDNSTIDDRLTPAWGFACVVEVHGRKILFDTGGNGRILLHNLRRLDIDPSSFDDIFISHPDFDHIGGLSHILNENCTAIVHNPKSFRGVRYNNEVKYYDVPAMLHGGIFTTGELGSREQSMIVEIDNGVVIVIGCCHPGLAQILDVVAELGEQMYPGEGFGKTSVVGGLHDFSDFQVIERIDRICPTHCTQHLEEIKRLFPGKYISGGAGKTLRFE